MKLFLSQPDAGSSFRNFLIRPVLSLHSLCRAQMRVNHHQNAHYKLSFDST